MFVKHAIIWLQFKWKNFVDRYNSDEQIEMVFLFNKLVISTCLNIYLTIELGTHNNNYH